MKIEIETGSYNQRRLEAEAAQKEKDKQEAEKQQLQLCTHNSMIPNGAKLAWKCAQCGYVYDRK